MVVVVYEVYRPQTTMTQNYEDEEEEEGKRPKSIIFAKKKGFRDFFQNIPFFRTYEWSLNLGREEIRVLRHFLCLDGVKKVHFSAKNL